MKLIQPWFLSAALMLVAATASTVHAAGDSRRIAYVKGDENIFVANLDGTGAHKITHGDYPDISPDGTRVTFNTVDSKTTVRHIAIADAATGKVSILDKMPSDNCFGPAWSPDGKTIAFYILIDSNWDLGLVNADGSGFRVVKKGDSISHSYFSSAWSPDGQSIFCQDLDNLYRIGLDGTVLHQWPMSALFKDGDVDSSARLAVSPDGAHVLADVGIDAAQTPKGWDGPAPSTWTVDIAAGTARRITPPFWWDACWLGPDEILCIAQGMREKEPSIYRRSVDGKAQKLLIKNATTVSVSR
jgi:TolB protein